MNDERTTSAEANPLADEVEELFQVAGLRPRLPDAELEPIKRELHAVWSRQVRHSARWRMLGTVAALAAGCLLVVGLVREFSAAPPAAQRLARLELQTGEVGIRVSSNDASGLAVVTPGSVISTGAGGRAALRLGSGPSLRLDVLSEVSIEAGDVVSLHRGSLYVDSATDSANYSTAASALEIVTPFATIRHVGTQYEARLLESTGDGAAVALRVRVREGAVQVERAGTTYEARAGSELVLRADGTIQRGPAVVHGSSWEWTQHAAPALDIEGLTLATFLAWVSRETALPWRYADSRLQLAAREIILHGSITGLTPEEALSVVLPGCALRHRKVEAGLLLER